MKRKLSCKTILNIFIFGLFIFFLGSNCLAKTNYYNLTPQEMAQSSNIVKKSYKFIINTAYKIKNKTLRQKVLSFINNPAPTFMVNYDRPQNQQNVLNKLIALKLADENISPKDFLPPIKNPYKQPQSFLSSPGGKYTGHHSYPGGLAVHTAGNLKIALSFIDTYQSNYNITLNKDVLIAAVILHDIMKPFVFQWKNDVSTLEENKIAGTGEHHIYAIAELLFRKFSPQIVVTLACAHTNPGENQEQVVNYIKAGAVLANVDAVKYGVLKIKEGKEVLPYPKDIEYFVNNIADGDWTVTETAAAEMIAVVQQIALKDYNFKEEDLTTKKFYQFRNYIFSQFTIMNLYYVYNLYGIETVVKKVKQIL